MSTRQKAKLPDEDVFCFYKESRHSVVLPAAQEWWDAGEPPGGNAKAQREGWAEIFKFLRKYLH